MNGRELVSKQPCTNLSSHGEAMGRKMRVAPVFALYQSVPKQGALQLGAEMSSVSVPPEGNRALCIDGDCCISLKTLLRVN